MKRGLFFTILPLLLCFGSAMAANQITLEDIDMIPNTLSPTTITAYYVWENDDHLQGVSNGYSVTVSGPATAAWVDGSGVVYNDLTGAMGWLYTYTWVDSLPSLILMGGTYMPGVFPGVSPGGPRRAHSFDVDLTFTGGTLDSADICIDTVFVPPAGDWVWDDGIQNLNPSFNGNQPYCFIYGAVLCSNPEFVTVPDGDLLSGDHCIGASFQFTADPVEPGGTITGYGIVDDTSGLAGIDNNGNFTFGAGNPGDYLVTIECYNDCPATSEPYTFTVSLTNAGLEYTNCPTSDLKASMGKTFVWDLGLNNFDCDAITENWSVISYTGSGTGVPVGSIDVTDGAFTFNTASDDVGTWVFEISGDDGWGETAACQFTLEITASSTWGIRIAKIGEKPDFVFQGHYAILPIYLDYMGSDPMGGFDFLIAYDASALTMINAERGEAISCWEYFQYRNGPFGNCTGMCPSGQLRVVAMAESNNGPYHPTGCDGDDGIFDTPEAELVRIKFYVTDDRTYECQFIPVYFFWMDCGDNGISNWTGNTFYIASHVYNLNWIDPNNPYYELIPPDGTIDENDRIYGAFDWCDENPDPGKPTPIRDIDFFNGGIDIACADEIDLRADLNLNNLAYEIADAVLYTNYFIYGPAVFTINYQGQVAASDVNNDGRALTVGDLVYLIRVLTGDAVPIEKLVPFANETAVLVDNNVVKINSAVDVGAALFVFDGEAAIENLSGLDMLTDVVDDQTRVLLYSIGTEHIDAGATDLLAIDGDVFLSEVEISDYNGSMMSTDIRAKAVPKAYALHQNFPNPFNPTTEIALDLPEAADWSVDIYNISGRLVKSYSGYSDAGVVRVNVDANGWASGIYLYKVTANDFTASKKMVLMK